MSSIIRISSELTMDSFNLFSKKMEKLEESEAESGIILIELSSPGGDAYAALAYAGRIRRSPLTIQINAYGCVASAAVLILAAGGTRTISREAWVMVHENSGPLEGNVVELEREAAQLRRLEVQWSDLLGKLTKTPAEVWTALHKETTYLNAEQCLALGLVDLIL